MNPNEIDPQAYDSLVNRMAVAMAPFNWHDLDTEESDREVWREHARSIITGCPDVRRIVEKPKLAAAPADPTRGDAERKRQVWGPEPVAEGEHVAAVDGNAYVIAHGENGRVWIDEAGYFASTGQLYPPGVHTPEQLREWQAGNANGSSPGVERSYLQQAQEMADRSHREFLDVERFMSPTERSIQLLAARIEVAHVRSMLAQEREVNERLDAQNELLRQANAKLGQGRGTWRDTHPQPVDEAGEKLMVDGDVKTRDGEALVAEGGWTSELPNPFAFLGAPIQMERGGIKYGDVPPKPKPVKPLDLVVKTIVFLEDGSTRCSGTFTDLVHAVPSLINVTIEPDAERIHERDL